MARETIRAARARGTGKRPASTRTQEEAQLHSVQVQGHRAGKERDEQNEGARRPARRAGTTRSRKNSSARTRRRRKPTDQEPHQGQPSGMPSIRRGTPGQQTNTKTRKPKPDPRTQGVLPRASSMEWQCQALGLVGIVFFSIPIMWVGLAPTPIRN